MVDKIVIFLSASLNDKRMHFVCLFYLLKLYNLSIFQMKTFPDEHFKHMLILIVSVYVICCLLVEVSIDYLT